MWPDYNYVPDLLTPCDPASDPERRQATIRSEKGEPMGRLEKDNAFKESCCDGGGTSDSNSCKPCGCDPGAGHKCGFHTQNDTPAPFGSVRYPNPPQQIERPTNPVDESPARLTTIHDSGKRVTFSSGSQRDPSEGKIKWSRISFGPMMRRWAQHLTAAEAKYPDPMPGVPNFTLIETQEELIRYKESAFRHFMSWFYDEMGEDHAAAVFFNINGVEIIKDKQRGKQ